jgi:hypothetical protein
LVWTVRFITLMAMPALVAVASVGCPSTPCAPYEKGGTCVELACPKASRVDSKAKSCVCEEGSSVIEGACVPYHVADTFCGPTSRAQPGGGCEQKRCALGEALDLADGACLPESTARTLSYGARPSTDEDERRASCFYGTLIRAKGAPELSCKAGPLACGRGERYAKPAGGPDAGPPNLAGHCEPTPACGAGTLFDESANRCIRVIRNDTVDVGLWARLALGPDGGEGTAAFCAPSRSPQAQSRFHIQLSFPDNDVTQVIARLAPIPSSAAGLTDAADRSLQQLVDTLRFMGGTASAASVSVELGCSPVPVVLPALEMKPAADGGT